MDGIAENAINASVEKVSLVFYGDWPSCFSQMPKELGGAQSIDQR